MARCRAFEFSFVVTRSSDRHCDSEKICNPNMYRPLSFRNLRPKTKIICSFLLQSFYVRDMMKSNIVARSSTSLLSFVSIKLHMNPIIAIEISREKLNNFIWKFVRIDILLALWNSLVILD